MDWTTAAAISGRLDRGGAGADARAFAVRLGVLRLSDVGSDQPTSSELVSGLTATERSERRSSRCKTDPRLRGYASFQVAGVEAGSGDHAKATPALRSSAKVRRSPDGSDA